MMQLESTLRLKKAWLLLSLSAARLAPTEHVVNKISGAGIVQAV